MPIDTIIGRGPLSGGTVIGDLTMAAGVRILFPNVAGSATLPVIAWADSGGVYDTGVFQGGTNIISVTLAGVASYLFSGDFILRNSRGIAFDTSTGGGDVFIEIDAANILAQRNSTSAQTWRLYETFTDASNNQGLSMDAGVTIANTITIIPFENGTGADDQDLSLSGLGTGDLIFNNRTSLINSTEGGTAKWTKKSSHDSVTLTGATTDTTTISVPSGARLLAVLLNVDTAVVNDGDDTWAAAFITGSTTTVAAAGTAAAQNTKITLMLPDEITTGIAEIRFTPQGADFTAGVIEVVVYYEELTPMANA